MFLHVPGNRPETQSLKDFMPELVCCLAGSELCIDSSHLLVVIHCMSMCVSWLKDRLCVVYFKSLVYATYGQPPSSSSQYSSPSRLHPSHYPNGSSVFL